MSRNPFTADCPMCAKPLEPCSTEHGIVWVCRECGAIAANLAVVRRVAPRPFVKHLWLAALQLGIPSKRRCPSCSQPLRTFGLDVEISPSCKVCCRCLLVWFDQPDLIGLHGGSDDQAIGAEVSRGIGRLALLLDRSRSGA